MLKKTIRNIFIAIAVILVLGVIVNFATSGLYDDYSETSSESGSGDDDQSVSLEGTNWIQTNAEDEDSYRVAYISGGRIEVFIVSVSEDEESGEETETANLYWSGSYEDPEIVDGTREWQSIANRSRTGNSTYASSDTRKTFSYIREKISFEYLDGAETKTCVMEQTDTDYEKLYKDTVPDDEVFF